MKAEIYAEGGGPPGGMTNIRCREGFTRLLESCGFDVGKFDVIASGGRGEAWNDFQDAHADAEGAYYVAMLIDSEEPVANIHETWAHLNQYDNWQMPVGAQDDQVLFMVTCMETWIVSGSYRLARTIRSRPSDRRPSGARQLGTAQSRQSERSARVRNPTLPRPLQQGPELIRDTRQAQPDRPGTTPPQLPPDSSNPERQAELAAPPNPKPYTLIPKPKRHPLTFF